MRTSLQEEIRIKEENISDIDEEKRNIEEESRNVEERIRKVEDEFRKIEEEIRNVQVNYEQALNRELNREEGNDLMNVQRSKGTLQSQHFLCLLPKRNTVPIRNPKMGMLQ